MPITDAQWEHIKSSVMPSHQQEIEYLENNEENRQIFLDMGFKPEDLDQYKSVVFYITLSKNYGCVQ